MPRLVRLVVPTPDRRRVLARPNGLAGWTLPVVPVPDGGRDGPGSVPWTPALAEAAARIVGAPVDPVRPVTDDAWEVAPAGRIPRAGVAWIRPDEAGRLGADARVVVAWAALEAGGGGPTTSPPSDGPGG